MLQPKTATKKKAAKAAPAATGEAAATTEAAPAAKPAKAKKPVGSLLTYIDICIHGTANFADSHSELLQATKKATKPKSATKAKKPKTATKKATKPKSATKKPAVCIFSQVRSFIAIWM